MKDRVTIYMDDGTPKDVTYDDLVRMFIKTIDESFKGTKPHGCGGNCKCNKEV